LRLDLFDHRALRLLGPARFAVTPAKPHCYSDAPAPDLAVHNQLIHHQARHVDRDGEADSDIAAGAGQDRGVDSDQPAVERDQRAAGVAGIDRGVGLDEVFVALDAEAGPAQRGNDARCDRLAKPERIADRQNEIADLERIAVTKWNRRKRGCGQVVALDAQQGQNKR
jgi:hypothetical protein